MLKSYSHFKRIRFFIYLKYILNIIIEQFLAITWIEWLGLITGALCVFLATKENSLNWPISIISIICYIYIFYNAKLYGDTLLQFYFLFTAIYGWIYWSSGKVNIVKSERPITKLSVRQLSICVFAVVMGGIFLGYFLDKFTDTDVPYLDGICTSMSFAAQFLLTRKKIENWIIWIIVDALYIPLYIYKNLNATAILYLIFLFIATKGFLDWKRKVKING